MELKREKLEYKKYKRLEFKHENVKRIEKIIEFNDEENCLDFSVEVETENYKDKFYFDNSTWCYDYLSEWELDAISNKFEAFKH